ncbi:MAG: hypothetical protein V2I76_11595 [Roseobacter sp.]|jgi:hypothetical protein|nr:hypothetical protein [Roseobacter sp.]
MAGINKHELERLIALGATVPLKSGVTGVRVVVQYRGRPTVRDRKAWAAQLQTWQHQIETAAKEFGAEPVEKSLSLMGQSMELDVPLDCLDLAFDRLEAENVGVKLQHERNAQQ